MAPVGALEELGHERQGQYPAAEEHRTTGRPWADPPPSATGDQDHPQADSQQAEPEVVGVARQRQGEGARPRYMGGGQNYVVESRSPPGDLGIAGEHGQAATVGAGGPLQSAPLAPQD